MSPSTWAPCSLPHPKGPSQFPGDLAQPLAHEAATPCVCARPSGDLPQLWEEAAMHHSTAIAQDRHSDEHFKSQHGQKHLIL
jgi:hypothetical protein